QGFEAFRGKLGKSAKALRAYCDFDVEFEKEAEKLGSYAFLRASEDVANDTYQGMMGRYTFMATRAGETASFIAPEIQAIPKKTMDRFLKSAALKPHILGKKEERLLAMQGEVAGTASKIFGQLTDADFKFGSVTDESGKKVELTQSSFRVLLESPKRAVRKQAFDKFYKVHEEHANTLAAALSSSVLQNIYHARVRNHPSALEGALFGDKIPVPVYDNLIAAVRNNTDTMHRYLELRRKALKLKELHSYDTYVPIVDAKRSQIPYAKAADLVCEALAPLGDAYGKTLRRGLHGRWVDRYENKGKRSGAFSAGGYTGPPYILMNYKEDVLDSAFTLAHEAGHSMHTYFSAKNQSFQCYQYTIFVAEVASTFNEQLLNEHLMSQAKDKTRRAVLINRELEEIRGTIIRQTMFAEYEKQIHAIAEAGEPLTLERLRNEYRSLLKFYFGLDFIIDDPLTLEGLRIPHFYRAFYVYKYATGLSAATALARGVLDGGKKDRDRYLTFLKSGGSKFPLELLRDAGVDLEKSGPVESAMVHFKYLVEELEGLL
ncbi:MAG: oligoendopeptidase F, partial [Candidatus Hydrogenedentes bacterium]|nr:oligoendopeptidase F [Candidatus Hydrogenedentota bacterium]